jgi:outer membrane protein assembly factor BamB
MFKRFLKKVLPVLTTCAFTAILQGQADGSLKWAFAWTNTPATFFVSSPAIGADGTVYIGSESESPSSSRVFAINPATGIRKWTFLVPDWVDSSPAVAEDGTIYIGCWDGRLYALRSTGSLKWTYETDNFIYSSPAIGMDGTIYVGSGDGNLHAINPDGTIRWVYPTLDWVDSSPAVGPDGTVYVGSWDNSLYAISADGDLVWSFATEGPVVSSPAVGEDGTIYVGSDDGYLYAIGSDGSLDWRYATGDSVEGSAAIGADGTIFVGSLDGYMYAINPDGTLQWRYFLSFAIVSSPAVRADGSIVFGAGDNTITCLSSAGDFEWAYETGDWVDSSPAIAADGTIYAGSFDNHVYAINGDQALADSRWPQFHLDSRRTGAVPVSSPLIAVQPFSMIVAPGDRTILQVIPEDPAGSAYQWSKGGAEIPGETNSILDLGAVALTDVGTYQAYVYNMVGEVWSDEATIQVVPGVDSRLTNISTRGRVEGVSRNMIPGFVVEGTGSLSTLIRGVGPTLGTLFDFQGFLPDPRFDLIKESTILMANDNWGEAPNVDEIIAATTEVGAFELDADSQDAAVLIDLTEGPYTAKVTGVDGSAGITLVEVYEVADESTPARLINISTRGAVGTGAAIMIPGFVIKGTAARAVLIRGVGPSLGKFEVSGFLENPRLVLFQGGEVINTNDDWQDAPNADEIAAAALVVGAFPLNDGSTDAAVLTVLPPGAYTAVVRGADGGIGTALVEVYQVP